MSISTQLVSLNTFDFDGKTEHLLPLPNTDAYMVVKTIRDSIAYVAKAGVSSFYKDENGFWQAPELNEGRNAYTARKAADCRIWGCE
jgi:hypothetical protein